ncbi:Histone deacetylase hda1, variant 3 [Mucor circinelloides]
MKRASEKEGNSVPKKPKSDSGSFSVLRMPQKANQSTINPKPNGAVPSPTAAVASPASVTSSNTQIETIVLSSDEENDDPSPAFKPKPKSFKQSSGSTSPSSQDLRNMGFTVSKPGSSLSKQSTPTPTASSKQAPQGLGIKANQSPKSNKPNRQLSATLTTNVRLKKKDITTNTEESSVYESLDDKNNDMDAVLNEPQSNIRMGLSDEDKEEIDELDSDSDADFEAEGRNKHPKILPIDTLKTRPPPSFPFSETSTLNEILKSMEGPSGSPQSTSSQQSNDLMKTVAAMRRLPVRESRNKVTTYNDIANSLDPSQFAVDYLSSADDESEIDMSNYPNAFAHHRDNQTAIIVKHNTQASLARPRRSLKTGFVYDTAMSYHATPDDTEIHPEDPRRIFKIFNIMERYGLLTECRRIKSRRATKEEILLVHNITHYRTLRNTSDLKTRAEYMNMEKDYDSIYLNSNSFESGLYAVGSLCNLVEAVVRNEIKNAFAIIRPPGHHAESDVPMGFCLFNNVAIATRYCMKKLNVKKTLIIDWDIHFGNGTQSIFSDDPNVLYISLHRYEDGSFYPSDLKGCASYTGHNKGLGRTVNIPWPCAGMTDADYIYAFREIVIPIAMEFDPDIVIGK